MAESLSEFSADELVQHRLDQQAVLADFGLVALRSRDLPILLQEATAHCAQGMKVRLCKVLRYVPAERMLVLSAGVGWREGFVGHARVGADLDSPAGYALQTGKPVISNHLENEERFRTPSLMAEHGVRRAINVLILAHDKPWGVLEADSPDEGRFDVADIAFMQGFANLVGVAIERHDAEERLLGALEHQRLLVQETSHRVKNSLTLVASLLHLQARAANNDDVLSALNEASARISAIAEAHDQLWRSNASGEIDLADFLPDLCERLQVQAPQIGLVCTIAPTLIDADRAITVGLLVTELITNAFKYAYPDKRGEVRVGVHGSDGACEISVSDDGVGLPDGFDPVVAGRNSLGMRMVVSLVRQLKASMTIESKNGATFAITFPQS